MSATFWANCFAICRPNMVMGKSYHLCKQTSVYLLLAYFFKKMAHSFASWLPVWPVVDVRSISEGFFPLEPIIFVKSYALQNDLGSLKYLLPKIVARNTNSFVVLSRRFDLSEEIWFPQGLWERDRTNHRDCGYQNLEIVLCAL